MTWLLYCAGAATARTCAHAALKYYVLCIIASLLLHTNRCLWKVTSVVLGYILYRVLVRVQRSIGQRSFAFVLSHDVEQSALRATLLNRTRRRRRPRFWRRAVYKWDDFLLRRLQKPGMKRLLGGSGRWCREVGGG